MNPYKLFLSLAFFTFYKLNAQEFAPLGSKWYYTIFENAFSPNESYLTIENIGDTIIQGKKCKILDEIDYKSGGNVYHFRYEYIYVSTDTVWRLADDGKFYTVYNFSAKQGDSWISKSYDLARQKDVEFKVTVDSITTIPINGKNLKKFKYKTEGNYLDYRNGSILEFFGGTSFMFPFNYGFLDVDIRNGLRCYSDPIYGNYNFGLVAECDQITTKVNEIYTKTKMNIFPNPSTGNISIKVNKNFKDSYLNIYSIEGKLIDKHHINSQVEKYNLDFKNPGIYLLELINNNYRAVEKVVVIN